MTREFSENLKRIMFEKALTQEQLAKKMKLDQSRISRWKTGESIPSAKNLKKLSLILGIPVSYLVNNKQISNKSKNTENNIDKKIKSLENIIKEINKKIIDIEENVSALKNQIETLKKN